jgi:hypothetical protein
MPQMSKGTEMIDFPIESLDLTIRTYNCLKREGITTAQAIAARTEDQLLELRNFGQRSVDECKEKLAERGLKLRPANRLAEWEKELVNTTIDVEHVTIYRCGDLAVVVNGDGSGSVSKSQFNEWELDALCQICEQIATGKVLATRFSSALEGEDNDHLAD